MSSTLKAPLPGTGESALRMARVYRVTYLLIVSLVLVLFVSYNSQTGWDRLDTLSLGCAAASGLVALLGAAWEWVGVGIGVALVLKVLGTQPPELHLPVQLLTCVGLVVLFLNTRRAGWIMTWIALGYVVLSAWAHGSTGFSLALDGVCLAVPFFWAAQRFVLVLDHRLDDLDAAHAERVNAELDTGFGGLREAVVRQRRRLMHDDLIATLTTLSRPGSVPAATVQQTCRDLAEQIDDLDSDVHPQEPDLVAALRREASRSGLEVELSGPPLASPVEPTVLAALRRATAETLRNVRRHAGVSEARIEWAQRDDRIIVTVGDRGRGSSQLTEGWGLMHSVREPIEQVGGTVTLSSAPGRGTTVQLETPAAKPAEPEDSLRRAHAWTVTALAEYRLLPIQLIALTLIANGLLALRRAWQHPTFWAEAALLVAIVTVALLVGRVLLTRALRGSELLVLGIIVAGLMATGLAVRGVEALTSFDSWFIGASVVVITVLAFYLPLLWLVGLVLPSAVVLTWAIVDLDRPLPYYAGAVVALLIPPILAYGFGSYLRYSWDQRQTEWERAARAALASQRRQLAEVLDAQSVAWLQEDLVPWLRDLGEGTVALDDPVVAEQSAHLALAVRDELNVPGALDAGLRKRIALARAAGVELSFHPADSGHGDQAASVLRVLDRLLDHADLVDRVLVRLPDAGQPIAEVTWVAIRRRGLSAEQRAHVLRPVAHLRPSATDDSIACTWTWPAARRPAAGARDLLGMGP